jgi:hypothetical protein
MSVSYYDHNAIQSICDSYIKLYKKTYNKTGSRREIFKEVHVIHSKITSSLYNWYDVSNGIPDHTKMSEYVAQKDAPYLRKMMWLFWDSEVTLVADDLVKLAVELNDPNLSEDDYALLMFISYQGEDVIKLAEGGMPLSILYDMYKPIAENNFEEWYKIQYVASGYRG